MKTKAKKRKNGDKNREKAKKPKPTNAMLKKLVFNARVKENGRDGSEETVGVNAKKIQNQQERTKQKKKKRKNNKKADGKYNSDDGYASPSSDDDNGTNAGNGLREEKPFDTDRKNKVKAHIEKFGGVEILPTPLCCAIE